VPVTVQADPAQPVVVAVPVKPPWLSRTLIINAFLLLVYAIGLMTDAAGIFHLTLQMVTALGIVAAVVNLGLRMATNSAIVGTPISVKSTQAVAILNQPSAQTGATLVILASPSTQLQ